MNFVRVVAGVCLALSCGVSLAVGAGPRSGEPLREFGRAGVATADLTNSKKRNSSNYATDATVDSKGRILISGARAAKVFDSAVIAFDRDGRIDRSWGTDGRIVHRFNWRGPYARKGIETSSIAIGPRGRIYTVDLIDRSTNRDWQKIFDIDTEYEFIDVSRMGFYVYAHDRSGRPIRAFGRNGHVGVRASLTGAAEENTETSVFDTTVADDGSIFLLYRHEGRLRVVKLKPNGRLDFRFGNNGRKTIPMSWNYDVQEMRSAKIFSVGFKILVAYAGVKQRYQEGEGIPNAVWASTRLTSAGAVDKRYGANGRAEFIWPPDSEIPERVRGFDAIVDGHDRLVLAGSATLDVNGESGADSVGAVVRYSKRGKLDETFGSSGVFRASDDSGRTQMVYGITAAEGGGYVIGTQICDKACDTFGSKRLTPSGEPSTGWSNGGISRSMGYANDIVGMYAADGRLYQVPDSLRQRGTSDYRFAALALRP